MGKHNLNNKLISVVVPIHNEESNIREMCKRIDAVFKRKNYELIFIDDGSTDKSVSIIESLAKKSKQIKLISFTRNFGQEAAFTAGLKYSKGDAAIIMDGDLQDPPELIPEFIKKWEQGYDIVYAKRTKRNGETVGKKILASLFYKTLHYLSTEKIPKNVGYFRIMDRSVINAFLSIKERVQFIKGTLNIVGYKQTYLTFSRPARNKGGTNYNFDKLYKLAFDGISSFSLKPFFLIIILGLSILIMSILTLMFFLICSVVNTSFARINFIFPLMGLLSGFQFIILGIMGEYLIRILIESKRRPLYFINKEVNVTK